MQEIGKDFILNKENTRIFASYQPQSVVTTLKQERTYQPLFNPRYDGTYKNMREILGYMPVFAVEMKDPLSFLIDNWIISPSAPESLIVFKSNKYTPINQAYWYAKKDGKEKLNREDLLSIRSSICVEYVMPEIRAENVLTFAEFKHLFSDQVRDMFNKIPNSKAIKSKLYTTRPELWQKIWDYFTDTEGKSVETYAAFCESSEYNSAVKEFGKLLTEEFFAKSHLEESQKKYLEEYNRFIREAASNYGITKRISL